MTLNDYLSFFPGNTREKTRFMALATAVLRQVIDLQEIVGEVNSAFAPASALGAQLEALAASLGLKRADTTAGSDATDEVFRDYIRKKLIRWGWDGTNASVPAIVAKIRAGAEQVDNQNGSVTVTGAGTQPAAVKEIFPIPAGVRTTA